MRIETKYDWKNMVIVIINYRQIKSTIEIPIATPPR